ncbi:GNAT family N-acetyltransferase [Neobacillus jeddahensis]|uniref:GNAT family N-acetyltransferase n=1 Tax=Neobacillus jeddahensis TaxID=1461580 RepID=UPI00058EF312|nr:GNAT family N-acetyltransferase [Neobacillus jeddahensis]
MDIFPIGQEKKKKVHRLYSDITSDLKKKGIHQWDCFYPNRFVINSDIKLGHLFGILIDNQVIGVIVLDTNENKQFQSLKWMDERGRPLMIHRLGIHPLYQGRGYGKKLLGFAGEYAISNGFSSMRLDVFSGNKGALKMYEHAGFQERGEICYPFRSAPYICFEKIVTRSES